MKKIVFCLSATLSLVAVNYCADAQFYNRIRNDVNNNINDNVNQRANSAPQDNNNTASANTANPENAASSSNPSAGAGPGGQEGPGDIHVYNNYDFVPGQTVLFEDHFMNDQDGEFPAQWKLEAGQAVMNNVAGVNAVLLTDGNYARVSPRIKTPAYMADPFTIEADYMIPQAGGYGLVIRFTCPDKTTDLHVGNDGGAGDEKLSGTYPGNQSAEAYRNRWHHIAISCKKNQLKMYVDQYRVMVDPDFILQPSTLTFCGIGDLKTPIIFTNVRIASGAGMNMIGKKFTDTKIITHGINFDYNKASIKPESMGTLNMVMRIMNDNPEIKFEVGGHTDGDGEADYNLTLSQQRAEAVRAQLIAMGIDGSRLMAKGYGKTKPVADNTTEEGKANNRRVEFVKK